MKNQYQIGQKAARLRLHADILHNEGKISESDRDAMVRDINGWADKERRIIDAKLQRKAS